MEILVEKYCAEDEQRWNDFILNSQNGCFFFNRSFLSYHGEKFEDHSLLFYNLKGALLAVLPAVINEGKLMSHPGLTFGGMIYKKKLRTTSYETLLASLLNYNSKHSINTLVYRPVPSFYSNYVNSFDQYFLVKQNAVLKKVQINFLADLNSPLNFKPNRKQGIKRSDPNLQVSLSKNLEEFYDMLSKELKAKYNTDPLHSLRELDYLMQSFPDNIKIFTAKLNGKLLGGILVFCFKNVVKAQYIISNALGYKHEAISKIVIELFHQYSKHKSYLDLGSAHLENGELNMNLVQFKESLGAFPAPIYTYELTI